MRPSSAAAALLAALLLAGCAQRGLPLGPTVFVPAGSASNAQGQADIVVRTFAPAPEGERIEIGGATCDVASILFSARLRTPARLVFPSFGPQSPTLSFACEAGELRGAAEQGVVTTWLRAPGAWPGPGPWGWPYGGYWGPGWGGWPGPSVPVFAYPDVDVLLR